MEAAPRKKSPRAPSIALAEALERALKVYEKEKRHAAPTDVIAQDIGYKSANNGAALAVLASMRYYGLLERVQEGKLAVSKDVESFKYAPSEEMKAQLLIKWLKAPNVFLDLLQRYEEGLPSDANLRYDLINDGFNPASAESVLQVFKDSVAFSKYFDRVGHSSNGASETPEQPNQNDDEKVEVRAAPGVQPQPQPLLDHDRIPIRLSGGRRAWLEIPVPFYEADKDRIKAQIDLLLTEESEKNDDDNRDLAG